MQTPLVPLIPCLSIVWNIYFMMVLDYKTWIRFIFWLLFGKFVTLNIIIYNNIYIFYKDTKNKDVVNISILF